MRERWDLDIFILAAMPAKGNADMATVQKILKEQGVPVKGKNTVGMALRRLASEGLLSSFMSKRRPILGGQPRWLYELTPEGQAKLRQMLRALVGVRRHRAR